MLSLAFMCLHQWVMSLLAPKLEWEQQSTKVGWFMSPIEHQKSFILFLRICGHLSEVIPVIDQVQYSHDELGQECTTVQVRGKMLELEWYAKVEGGRSPILGTTYRVIKHVYKFILFVSRSFSENKNWWINHESWQGFVKWLEWYGTDVEMT